MKAQSLHMRGGRITISFGGKVFIRDARIGICADRKWEFPFEYQADISTWRNYEDPIGVGQHQCVTAVGNVNDLTLRFHVVAYNNRPMYRIWLTLCNHSTKTVKLDGIHLLDIIDADGGAFDCGCPVQDAAIFTDNGHGWAGVARLSGHSPDYSEATWNHLFPPETRSRIESCTGSLKFSDGDHSSPGGPAVIANISKGNETALLLGYAPLQRALSTIVCHANATTGMKFLIAASGLYGCPLRSGTTYSSEDLLVGCFGNGLEALTSYAEAAASLRAITIKVKTKDVPSGWISWYGYRLQATEDAILANARIIADRFLHYGMDIIQPDYCWQKDFIPNEWREANANFPHGIHWLGERLKEMGLKMGFWICPVNVSSKSKLFDSHPEYLLKDENADLVKLGNWTWGSKEQMYVIDPTVPGAIEDALEQIKFLKHITGAQYWKFDFIFNLLVMGKKPVFADASRISGVETYRLAIKALRKTVGDDFIYFCSNFPCAEYGIGDTTTTAHDIGNPCFSKKHSADDKIYGLTDFRENASTILAKYFLHRRLTLLNADAANLGPEGDLAEARLRFSLVAFSGGQFFLGDNLTIYSEERLAMVEKALPIYGKAACPLDLFASPFPDSPRIWHVPITTAWDDWDVICLANMAEATKLNLDLLDIFPECEDELVFDFWEEKLLGRLRDNSQFILSPIESRMLCLRRSRKQPHLIATNMHFTMGGVEVLEHSWVDSSNKLKLKLCRRPGAQGKLWINIPSGFAMKGDGVFSNGAKAKISLISDELVVVDVDFLEKVAHITLNIENIKQ